MSTPTNETIYNVNSQNFHKLIIEKSNHIPVLVDFWAPWCGPCKTLTPLLEKIAREYQGKIALAKINTDEEQMIAAQFRIQSIPTVILVHQGKIANGFTGALPEAKIKEFLAPYLMSPEEIEWNQIQEIMQPFPLHDPSNEKWPDQQLKEIIHVVQEFVTKFSTHTEAKILLAELFMKKEDWDKATELLSPFQIGEKGFDRAQTLLKKISLSQNIKKGESDRLRQTIDANSTDWPKRLQLAEAYTAEENYISALEEYFAILELSPKKADDAPDNYKKPAHQGILTIFGLLGPMHADVIAYRRRLANVLF